MGWAGTPEAFRSSAGDCLAVSKLCYCGRERLVSLTVTGRRVRGTWERPGRLQAEEGCMEGGSSGSSEDQRAL